MAVFYNREKSKIGTNTGTIIHWSKQLTSNDPDNSTTKNDLPSGYLRCDGSIYSAEIYPQLAEILGIGSQCRYKKPDTTLLDNQFQLPDLGSKKIRASSSSNLGEYLDTYIEDDNGNTITKSGVGLEVQSNIGETYEIQYTGSFFLPSQQIEVTGEPGFTRSTGNYTESSDVLNNAFIPHSHFHDGTRTRIAASSNEYSAFGRNSYTQKSTLCVVDWANNTRQDLCLYNATRIATSETPRTFDDGTCKRTYYGGCFTGCEFLSSYECLIPEGYSCEFPSWSGDSTCGGSPGPDQSTECGKITYDGPMAAKCEDTGIGGCLLGGLLTDAIDKKITLEPNYFEPNLPFDSFKDSDQDGYAAITNVTNQAAPFGDQGEHRHFVNFSTQPQTFVVNTRPTFVPASEIVSTISVRVNRENKADQFVQPYIVQEFLIKY